MRFTIFLLLFPLFLSAQSDYYYPPLLGNIWETTDAEDLGWCTDSIPPLLNFIEETNGKGFIILHKGRIVVEEYFDDFTQDSVWYWASAGKSLVGFLTGMAQEDGLLNINDASSDYLGLGWTNMTTEQEAAITIKHQLSMSSGIDFDVDDLNCTTPECLNYLSAPEENWYYHNAPYRLVQGVLENASGQTMNTHTYTQLSLTTGITGLWVEQVFFSKPRSMARFGLLNLSHGIWNGTAILSDTYYLNAMTSSSQSSNLAYGYLWWLNGKESYKLPQFNITVPGSLIPTAPDDMYAALGKNDQKIYVVPSLDLVVVRLGNQANEEVLALSGFDDELWEKIMGMICTTTAIKEDLKEENITIIPNLVQDYFRVEARSSYSKVMIYDTSSKMVKSFSKNEKYSVSDLEKGLYFVQIFNQNKRIGTKRIIIGE